MFTPILEGRKRITAERNSGEKAGKGGDRKNAGEKGEFKLR